MCPTYHTVIHSFTRHVGPLLGEDETEVWVRHEKVIRERKSSDYITRECSITQLDDVRASVRWVRRSLGATILKEAEDEVHGRCKPASCVYIHRVVVIISIQVEQLDLHITQDLFDLEGSHSYYTHNDCFYVSTPKIKGRVKTHTLKSRLTHTLNSR